jgi:hypothetical protein
MGITLKAARGSDPVWQSGLVGWPRGGINKDDLEGDINKDDLGDVDDFEMEIKEWFRLSTSLKSLEIYFVKVEEFI